MVIPTLTLAKGTAQSKHTSKEVNGQRPERLTTVLRNYWATIRAEFAFPAEEDLNPMALGDIWDNCFIVEANNFSKPQDYVYKYVGDCIKNAYKEELRGMDLTHIVSPQPAHLANDFEKVLATKSPVYYEGEMKTKDGRILKYRHILLPLGSDGINIEAIMGGFSYKIISGRR